MPNRKGHGFVIVGDPFDPNKGGHSKIMRPTAIWIIYTLMFGYPVPTLGEHEFASEAACVIHMRSFSAQVIDAFQLVCARRSVVGS
jgi:hypothetical protein